MVEEHSSADSTSEITAKPYLSKKLPSSGSSGLSKLQVHITSVVMAAIGVYCDMERVQGRRTMMEEESKHM